MYVLLGEGVEIKEGNGNVSVSVCGCVWWDALKAGIRCVILCVGCVFVWQNFQRLAHIFESRVCKQINTRRVVDKGSGRISDLHRMYSMSIQ